MKKLEFESTVHKQRFSLGIICLLLPILCSVFGIISGSDWTSISVTYHSFFSAIMISALCLCAFFLFTYQGYDLGDRIFTVLSGIGAIIVICFPCYASSNIWRYGILGDLLSKTAYNVCHYIGAILVFGDFAIMTLTQFTKGKDKKRNIVYYICGGIMAISCLLFPTGWFGRYHVMILEFVMLLAFSISWIVKSKVSFKNNTTK